MTERPAAKRARSIAAERAAPRRIARVGAATNEDTASLRVRVTELEARNALLADRLEWALDKLTSIIDDLKSKDAG